MVKAGEGKTDGAVNGGSFISHFIMMCCLHMVLESLEHSIHNNALMCFLYLLSTHARCSPKQPFSLNKKTCRRLEWFFRIQNVNDDGGKFWEMKHIEAK